MRVLVVAIVGLGLASVLASWPAPVRSADPVAVSYPAAVFRGGNQGWGLILDTSVKPVRYNLVVPQLVGVAYGSLIPDPQIAPQPNRYALIGRVNVGGQSRELVVRISKAASGQPCLDSAGKAHGYAVIAGAAKTANWYGCGDFAAQ
ncbi:MAG: hypothetical protein HOQ32_19910 [Lysobacter sp.]|nr:hypothetical protein [Lysobacter sp.]